MRITAYMLLMFFSLSGCYKPDKKKSEIMVLNRDCKWGQTEFADDKSYGLQLIRYGMPRETDDYFWSILEKDYHITIKFNEGCSIEKGVECYLKSASYYKTKAAKPLM